MRTKLKSQRIFIIYGRIRSSFARMHTYSTAFDVPEGTLAVEVPEDPAPAISKRFAKLAE